MELTFEKYEIRFGMIYSLMMFDVWLVVIYMGLIWIVWMMNCIEPWNVHYLLQKGEVIIWRVMKQPHACYLRHCQRGQYVDNGFIILFLLLIWLYTCVCQYEWQYESIKESYKFNFSCKSGSAMPITKNYRIWK